ncbi:MAG: hypothetical protein LBP53_00755 [Candidatus Peribacteria bacterium]|jgi:hypothetical protein|nr:hypothetical protein [Candidatus Peribacteria bacterium]
MEEHKVPINEESKAETLHTPELSRKYYTLENEIIGQLRDVLIMYKLRTEKSHTVPMYKFDENREIVNYSNAFMKDPLRITEDTRNIYILKIYRSFLRLLKQEELPDTIREKYQQSIKNFIKTNFSLPHKQFEKHPFEKHLPLQEAWKLYQNRFKNKEIT